MSSTYLRKQMLRKQMLIQRTSLSSDQRITKTQIITQKVIDHPLFQESEEIYCYLDYRQEVGTRDIISKAWKSGKKVAIPKVVDEKMQFCYIQNFEETIIGYKGIEEPKNSDIAE